MDASRRKDTTLPLAGEYKDVGTDPILALTQTVAALRVEFMTAWEENATFMGRLEALQEQVRGPPGAVGGASVFSEITLTPAGLRCVLSPPEEPEGAGSGVGTGPPMPNLPLPEKYLGVCAILRCNAECISSVGPGITRRIRQR